MSHKSAIPPEGYSKLPKGWRCRCLRLWFDGESHWCCLPPRVSAQAATPIKETKP